LILGIGGDFYFWFDWTVIKIGIDLKIFFLYYPLIVWLMFFLNRAKTYWQAIKNINRSSEVIMYFKNKKIGCCVFRLKGITDRQMILFFRNR
jgi:hypothetical protein